MKFLFWLLVILNLGALVYFNMDKLSPPRVAIAKPDLQAENLKLLNAKEVDAMPERVVLSEPRSLSNEPSACYTWGSFNGENLSGVENILNAMNIPHASTLDAKGSVRHWVYKPPFPSFAAAQAKGRELKSLGINEFFIVQTPKMRNAISFGVFRDEKLALRLMDNLRRRGVRELVKSVRNQGATTTSITMADVTETLLTQLHKNQPDYPLAEIKKITCPAR